MIGMHPSTMNQIGVCLGEFISVNDILIAQVWPSWSVSLTCISLSQDVMDLKDLCGEQFLLVRPLSTLPTSAHEVLVKEW